MAKTNWQDPRTGEIISPHISGLQEAVGKIEESIGMNTISETDIPLTEAFISNDDRCRIYQAPEGKRNWLLSPTPLIKKNGTIITEDFEVDYGGGAIVFTTPILESDILTADVTYTAKVEGKQLSDLGNKINQVEREAKEYTDQQITLVTETGIPKLNVYEYIFSDVAIGTTEIEIPLETFYAPTDEVELFINTVPRDSDFFTKVDAIRDENGDLLERGKVVLTNALVDVSKVTIKVWKNIPIGEEGSVSGNVIAVDSMPLNRVQGLSDELDSKVDKVGKQILNKDYNNATEVGWYMGSGDNSINAPPDGLPYGMLLVQKRFETVIFQLAIYSNSIATRQYAIANQTWTPWVKYITDVQVPWLTATLQSGWLGTARYRKNSLGLIDIDVNAYGGTITKGTTIFTLPINYRPVRVVVTALISDTGIIIPAGLYSYPSGEVRLGSDVQAGVYYRAYALFIG